MQERFLNGVLGVTGITQSSNRHGPRPVLVSPDDLGERFRIPREMSSEQFGVARS